ncbi:MAG: YesL family protein [Lachnospiraceae bacterium]|nr:YesL family protein [Lachnospiraceae bacterium]
MSGFFSSDNKFFILMSKIFDMLVLSIVWLLLSISGLMLAGYFIGTGIVEVGSGLFFVLLLVSVFLTCLMGPASTAFYYTVVKVIRRERSYLFKEFFRSFKLNFKQGMLIALIYVIIAFVAAVDMMFLLESSGEGSKMSGIMLGAFFVLVIFTVFSIVYVFPVLSRFTVTIKNLIKWAFFMSIRHIGWTLLLAVMFLGCGVLMYFSFFYMPPLMVVLPGVYTLLASFPMEHIFKRYMPQEEESDEESGIDRWYNE